MNLVPTQLFGEIALLQLIGYTTTRLRSGFCQWGHLAHGPMHKYTLADALDKLTAEELELLLNGTAQRLVAHGFFAKSNDCFALDALGLPTPSTYTGRGRLTQVHKKLTKDKRIVEIEEYVYGFQVFVVYEIHRQVTPGGQPKRAASDQHRYDWARPRFQACRNPDALYSPRPEA